MPNRDLARRKSPRIAIVAGLAVLAAALTVALVMHRTPAPDPGDAIEPFDTNVRRAEVSTVEPESARATDLLDVLDASARKSDPESLRATAMALDECHLLSVSPDHFALVESASAESTYGRNLPFLRKLAPAYIARCARVAAVTKPRTADVLAALIAAASTGDPWANAKLFRRESQDLSVDESDRLLGRILASRDPDAILALADYMYMPRDGSRYTSLAGSNLHVQAWQLAACDLGADCSATGRLMRDACLFGGICGEYGDWRSMLASELLTPQDYARVEDIKAAILHTIRSN